MSAVVSPTAGRRESVAAAAGAVAARVSRMAQRTRDGAVVWLAPPDGTAPPRALGPQLYDGTPGVALFLAAMDHVRGGTEHRELVLHALAPLRRSLAGLVADRERAGRLRLAIGGMAGVGGWIYALLRTGGWLGEEALVSEAHALTALLTPGRVAADDDLDVVGGCAGAILALLALHAAAPTPGADGRTPLDVAHQCGERLLAARVSHGGKPRAWPGGGGPPLSGFAHGASGVAHALFRLAAHTGDERMCEAAHEGITFERTLWNAEAAQWWDPRFGRPLEQVAWCHGTPGIALARAAAAAAGEGELKGEARALLQGVRSLAAAPVDHLCCGNAGAVDILLSAHAAFPELGLEDDALRRAGELAERAEDGLSFGVPPEPPGFRVDLFRGASGVGMALLRAASRTVPSPLLLE